MRSMCETSDGRHQSTTKKLVVHFDRNFSSVAARPTPVSILKLLQWDLDRGSGRRLHPHSCCAVLQARRLCCC